MNEYAQKAVYTFYVMGQVETLTLPLVFRVMGHKKEMHVTSSHGARGVFTFRSNGYALDAKAELTLARNRYWANVGVPI